MNNFPLDNYILLEYITNMNNDLATYIADRNAKTLEWVNAGKGRWATTLVEDLDHWAEYGIHTPLQLDWYLAACDRHQACKDAYGYKPYWGDMPTTDAELKAETVELDREAREAYEDIRAQDEADRAEEEYQRQLAGEHTPAVKEALKPSPSFTIGELCPL